MNKPYISIIFPTMRPGGLDFVFASLENQTFNDFELIIVDNLYEYRKDIVKEKAKQYSIQYKHIPPIINKFPVHSYPSTMNSGIVWARGEITLLTLDYRYFMPNSLQKHADFHKAAGYNVGYAAASKFVVAPSIKSGLPSYGYNDDYDQYIKDLEGGVFQSYMWSIFEKEFDKDTPDTSTWQEVDRLKHGYDPKTDIPLGTILPSNYIFLHSESLKTEIILAANGINEALDGAHSHQDVEFAQRLQNMFDFKWVCDNTNITYRTDAGHSIVAKLKLIEEVDNAASSIFAQYQNGSTTPANSWNLKQAHGKNQEQNAAIE